MLLGVPHFILVLISAEIATSFVFNESLIDELEKKFQGLETRRQAKKSQSTSSSQQRRPEGTGADSDHESLQQSFSGRSSTDTDEKKRVKKDRTPKSTVERTGWRKWHRQCTKCPEDMHKKWRDPSIKWICGAYQRARRTFKSLCMMHYRNCQDGTMFTKISDHRCANGSDQVRPYNFHFFYDYNVILTGDDTESGTVASSESEKSSSSWDTSAINKLPPRA